jgi:hypothetical protein
MFSLTFECLEEHVGGMVADNQGRARLVNIKEIKVRGSGPRAKHTVVEKSGSELQTASAVIDALGGTGAVAKVLETSPAAVSNWRAANRFPARSYLTLMEALKRKDYTAPDLLWTMRKKA